MPTTTVLVASNQITSSFTPYTGAATGCGTTPPAVSVSNDVVTVTSRGYYNSNGNFDPGLNGGIVVSGVWTYGVQSDNMQIITRSDGVGSGSYGEVNSGLEFECYNSQCYIGTRAGGSLTTLVSTGFGVTAGQAYNFQVIDTGTYVLFAVGTGSTWSMVLRTSTTTRNCINKVVFHNRECGYASPGSTISGITIAQLAATRTRDLSPAAIPCSQSPSPSRILTPTASPSQPPSVSFSSSATSSQSLTAAVSPTGSVSVSTSFTPSVSPTISNSGFPTPTATASQYLHPNMPTGSVLVSGTITSFFTAYTAAATGCGSPYAPAVSVASNIVTVTARGYYNSNSNYDPQALGGIVVTGTWTYQVGTDNMQIITRSDGVGSGAYGEVNSGIEFECYSGQCYIGTRVGGGLTYLASTGFSVATGTPYNFQVVDTGTDVFFAVGQGSTWTMTLFATSPIHNAVNKVTFHNRECNYGSPGSKVGSIIISTLAITHSPTTSVPASGTPTISPSSTQPASHTQTPSVTPPTSNTQTPTASLTPAPSTTAQPSTTQSVSSAPSTTSQPSETTTPSVSVTAAPSTSQPASETQTPSSSGTAAPSTSQPASETQTPSASGTAAPSLSQPATESQTPSGATSPSSVSSDSNTATRTGAPSITPTASVTPSPIYAVAWTASQQTLSAGQTATITATLLYGVLAPFPFQIQWSASGSAGDYSTSITPLKCTIATGTSSCGFTVTNIMSSGSSTLTLYAIAATASAGTYQFTPVSYNMHLYAVLPSTTASLSSSGSPSATRTSSSTATVSRSVTVTSTATRSPTRMGSDSRSLSASKTGTKTTSPTRTGSMTRSPTPTPIIGATVLVSQDVSTLTGGGTGHITCTLTTGPVTIDIVVSFTIGGTSGLIRNSDYATVPATGSTLTIPAGSTTAVLTVTASSAPPDCVSVAAGQCKVRLTFNSATHSTFAATSNLNPLFVLN